MIYLKAQGRFGNQLFQYAFAKYLSNKYEQEICINFDRVRKNSKSPGDGWENGLSYFDIKGYNEIFYKDLKYFWVWMKLKIVRIILKVCHRRNNLHGEKYGVIYCYEPKMQIFEKIHNKNIILDGLFEYSYIVDDVIDEIRNDIFKNNYISEKNSKLLEKISEDNSICVTVRKFDMEDPKFEKFYQKCTVEFYYRGIEYILKKYPDANIIVFSDQIQWCRDNLKLEDRFKNSDISYETEGNSISEKLQMMSRCSHFVISNSTFSWWAQRLSDRKEDRKIVCAPIRWNDKYLTKEIGLYCDNWIMLDN